MDIPAQSSEAMPPRWDTSTPLVNSVPQDMRGLHWEQCYNYVNGYDEDMCRIWKEEIDKLLIFAGLFSAAVTAFAVESYQWLEDPSDANTALLAQLVALQLQGTPGPTTTPFSPSNSALRINIFWFTSLTLSLGSVLVGILCLQWLREYQRPAPTLSFQDKLTFRHNRYEGLIAWKVPEIVSSLPILLQISVIFFFTGIFDLLWARNRVVGLCILVQFCIITLILGLSAIMPAFQMIEFWFWHSSYPKKVTGLVRKQCPYKSPQSWATCTILLCVLDYLWRFFTAKIHESIWTRQRHKFKEASWLAFDDFWFQYGNCHVADCMGWMQENCPRDSTNTYHLYQCLSELPESDFPTVWKSVKKFKGTQAWPDLSVLLDTYEDPFQHMGGAGNRSSYRELVHAFFLDAFHQAAPSTVEHWIRAVNAEPLLFEKMPTHRILQLLPKDKHDTFIPQILLCIDTFLQNRHHRDQATGDLLVNMLDILSKASRTESTAYHSLIQRNTTTIRIVLSDQTRGSSCVGAVMRWVSNNALHWVTNTTVPETRVAIIDLAYVASIEAGRIVPPPEARLNDYWLRVFHVESWQEVASTPSSQLWWRHARAPGGRNIAGRPTAAARRDSL